MKAPVRVLFVMLPDSLALDWAGPAEALRIANGVLAEQGQPPAFAVEFVGPDPEPMTSVGIRLRDIAPLPVLGAKIRSSPLMGALEGMMAVYPMSEGLPVTAGASVAD